VTMRNQPGPGFCRPPQGAGAAFEITPSIGPRRLFVFSVSGSLGNGALGLRAPSFLAGAGNAGWPAEAPIEWQPPAEPEKRARQGTAGGLYWARPISGQVVRDRAGRLCEVRGRELRPLHRIARDPLGQLLELLPGQSLPTETEGEEPLEGELVSELPAKAAQHHAPERAPAAQPLAPAKNRCRKLFAEPGLPRVLELGRFRPILAAQLAHPERLREEHRLACHLQIYQALVPQRADEFLEALEGVGKALSVQPLLPEVIRALGLAEFLARHPRPPERVGQDPGHVLANEYFFSLRIASDPTAGATRPAETTPAAVRANAVPVPAKAVSPAAVPAAAPLVREIPERFLNPWEFRASREEALYDMSIGAASGAVRRALRKIGAWFLRREEYRKWRALLVTRDLEEQLWAVRPPRSALADPAVREWAKETLESAGYDARTMLLEWEVFWRRKVV